jgi:hypothetical protein
MTECLPIENSAGYCRTCERPAARVDGIAHLAGHVTFCPKCCPACNAKAEEPKQKRRYDGPFRFKRPNRKDKR